MRRSLKPLKSRTALLLAAACVTTLGGCKSFLDQSELTRGNRAERLVVPILSSIDPIDQAETEFPNATDVQPQDLKPFATDYEIGRNDLVTVSVYDLVGGGVESVRTARVSETGMLSLPLLGEPVPAAGLTEAQLQRTIADRYREAGILQNAQVSVTVVEQRQRTFSALGAVGRPGQYAILEADFRMLDALIQVGDTTHPAEFAYILRRKNQDAPKTDQGTPNGAQPGPTGTQGGPEIQPPMQTQPGTGPGTAPAGPVDLAPRGEAPVKSPVVRPVLATMQQGAGTAAQPPVPPPAGQEERYIYVDGKPVLVPATQGTTAAPGTVAPAPGAMQVAPNEGAAQPGGAQPGVAQPGVAQPGAMQPTAVDRNEVTGAGVTGAVGAQPGMEQPGVSGTVEVAPTTQPMGMEMTTGEVRQRPYEFGAGLEQPDDIRVIRVPLQALKSGDLRFNVVIRPNDRIIVPSPVIGEYYVGGHAAGGGVFSLTGRQITLKQAIVSARMLDPLAVPWRTDIVRRVGRDKEVFVRVNLALIFEGRQPDIFLKPNDVVTIGTDWYAPFLAAIRGAFRASYGFGFIYDRNFAPAQDQPEGNVFQPGTDGGTNNPGPLQ